ncbi:MAG: hypothetical protein ABW069_06040 [Duganella sp.]
MLCGFEFINKNKINFDDIAQSEFKQPEILAQNGVSWQAEQGSAPCCATVPDALRCTGDAAPQQTAGANVTFAQNHYTNLASP